MTKSVVGGCKPLCSPRGAGITWRRARKKEREGDGEWVKAQFVVRVVEGDYVAVVYR
jgi:hypothetical protein